MNLDNNGDKKIDFNGVNGNGNNLNNKEFKKDDESSLI
jgi:hypothetical protein